MCENDVTPPTSSLVSSFLAAAHQSLSLAVVATFSSSRENQAQGPGPLDVLLAKANETPFYIYPVNADVAV